MSTTISAVCALGLMVESDKLSVVHIEKTYPHDYTYSPETQYDPRTGKPLWKEVTRPIYDEASNTLNGYELITLSERDGVGYTVIAQEVLGEVDAYDRIAQLSSTTLAAFCSPTALAACQKSRDDFLAVMGSHDLRGEYGLHLVLRVR